MSENTSVQFWKFEIEVVGKPSVLFSNPVVLNVLCSTLTSHEQQVVVKIGFSMRNFAHIVIVTKGEEAKDLLLRSYSSRLMFNELKNIANNLFSDICVKSVELVEMGLSIFDGQHLEFEQVKRDVKKLLETIDGALTTQSEVIHLLIKCMCFNKKIIQSISTNLIFACQYISSCYILCSTNSKSQ